MKNLILVFAAIAISTIAIAQTDSTYRKKSQRDMNNNQHQKVQTNAVVKSHSDGVMMKNGKVMKVKNGKMTLLKERSMTMSDGTKVMRNGTCIRKDGTKKTIKEGQHMDMSGNMVPMKTNKKIYIAPDSNRNKKINY